MRVLYIAAWFPYPPDNGARIRTLHLMKALRDGGHEVFMISLLQDDSDPGSVKDLSDICSVVSLHPSRWFQPGTFRSMLGLFSSTPRSVIDTYEPAVRRSVLEAVESVRPDVIVASTLGVAVYVPHNLGIPTILDEHNCEYAVMKRSAGKCTGQIKRLLKELGWRKSARWEARICRAFDAVTIVTEQDRCLLTEAAGQLGQVHVVPNGVDTMHYTPTDRQPTQGALVYNGALTYGANLDAVRFFVTDIYPLLKGSHSDIRLSVTGRTDGVDLASISSCPAIDLTGYVADIRDVLRRSAVCVVPLRQGGGSRLKILEAMAAGVPVVSTTIGAEGLDVTDGVHLLLADAPGDFAAAVKRLLDDRKLSEHLSRQARILVEAQYSWASIGRAFVRVVETVAR